jgi:hypothetical protein
MVATSPLATPDWDYAPAPESADVVSIAPRYGLFIGGEFAPPAAGEYFATLNPATEQPLAEVAQAGEPDVDRAVAAARAAYEGPWGATPGRDRAKYLYRIARVIQERAREFAVLESLDNGKPIKESRDAGRRALLLLRGLGGQTGARRIRLRSAAARGGRAGHPVELPAADGGLEAGPGAGGRQHVRAQAGRDHAADRAAAGRGHR